MRILFLSGHLPLPLISGGRRREYELLTRLGKRFEIHLCCVSKTYPVDRNYISQMRVHCADVSLFKAADHGVVQQTSKKLLSFPYQVLRHSSREFTSFVSRALKEKHYDIIHFEGYYLMPQFLLDPRLPILLVEQNVEYLLYRQRLMLAKTKYDREHYRREYLSTQKWERRAWQRATMCVAVTKDDQHHIMEVEPGLDVRLVLDGADHQTIIENGMFNEVCMGISKGAMEPTILFVGNFAYEPNVDAALHLSRVIFPLILRNISNAKLLLVGNSPPLEILALATNPKIVVTGLVPSLDFFLNGADVIVCPLRIGGGIKVKILEALNAGKAIVSTSIGVQGLELKGSQPICVADDPADFAKQVVHLLLNPGERMHLEDAARKFAKELPTWDSAAEALAICYEQLRSAS